MSPGQNPTHSVTRATHVTSPQVNSPYVLCPRHAKLELEVSRPRRILGQSLGARRGSRRLCRQGSWGPGLNFGEKKLLDRLLRAGKVSPSWSTEPEKDIKCLREKPFSHCQGYDSSQRDLVYPCLGRTSHVARYAQVKHTGLQCRV